MTSKHPPTHLHHLHRAPSALPDEGLPSVVRLDAPVPSLVRSIRLGMAAPLPRLARFSPARRNFVNFEHVLLASSPGHLTGLRQHVDGDSQHEREHITDKSPKQ